MSRPPEGFAAEAAALALAQLAEGHEVRLVARGASMWPFILDGDRLLLRPDGRARVGDVVLLRQGEFGLIHRVVARLPGRICTKGDALPRTDGWHPRAAIVARVARVERGGEAFAPMSCLPLVVSAVATLWPRAQGASA